MGYNTINGVGPSKLVALTVQFENVAGNDIAVTDLVTSSSPTMNASFASADQIWRWDSATDAWRQYYNSKKNTMSKTVDGWCLKGDKTNTTDRVGVGETFFFVNHAKTDVSLTLAGGVKAFNAEPAYSVGPSKLVFMGNPWPMEMEIYGFETKCSSPASNASFASADQIWRWDSATDAWRQYYNSKKNTMSKTVDGWCLKGDKTNTTDRVSVGEGFFFVNHAKVDQTITFTNAAE